MTVDYLGEFKICFNLNTVVSGPKEKEEIGAPVGNAYCGLGYVWI